VEFRNCALAPIVTHLVHYSGLDAIKTKLNSAERQEAKNGKAVETSGCQGAMQVCGARVESVISEVIDGWGDYRVRIGTDEAAYSYEDTALEGCYPVSPANR